MPEHFHQCQNAVRNKTQGDFSESLPMKEIILIDNINQTRNKRIFSLSLSLPLANLLLHFRILELWYHFTEKKIKRNNQEKALIEISEAITNIPNQGVLNL